MLVNCSQTSIKPKLFKYHNAEQMARIFAPHFKLHFDQIAVEENEIFTVVYLRFTSLHLFELFDLHVYKSYH